jgi:hypothetical protein
MSYSCGDVVQFGCNHPTQGAVTFQPLAATDSMYDPGGPRNSDDANSVTSSGRPIFQKNMKKASFQTDVTWEMVNGQTLEIIAALQASSEDAAWWFRCINGVTYSLVGQPVGDVIGNGNTSKITLKIEGDYTTFYSI